MSKHPTPWKLNHHEVILDANERFVCAPTSDPETRAVLLHSREMWEALNELTSVEPGSAAHRHADAKCCEVARKINVEIAKRNP